MENTIFTVATKKINFIRNVHTNMKKNFKILKGA